MLADTHAHLYWPNYTGDLGEILERAKALGLGIIINVGVDVKLSQKALDQVEGELSKYPGISFYSTIGIHPHEAHRYITNTDESIQQDIAELERIYQKNPQKVIAVGECGLDYLFKNGPDFNPPSPSIDQIKDFQKKLFQAQIELAKNLNLPIIAHIRDDRTENPDNSECWNEALDMLEGYFGILHCYSGTPDVTKRALGSKYLFSFAANITYPKNEYLRQAAREVPLERIVLETDSPFLSPQSKRGQRNEPSSVKESAQLIAELKGITEEEVAHQTTENVKMLFGLK